MNKKGKYTHTHTLLLLFKLVTNSCSSKPDVPFLIKKELFFFLLVLFRKQKLIFGEKLKGHHCIFRST